MGTKRRGQQRSGAVEPLAVERSARRPVARVYPYQYNNVSKPLRFLGDSLDRLRAFPIDARHDAGYQLEKVQRGELPDDFKPMPSIGKGVEEVRVRDESGSYRVIYTARRSEAVYVLHAFQKRTPATAKREVDLIRKRFNELTRGTR
jgi:phage-related protein